MTRKASVRSTWLRPSGIAVVMLGIVLVSLLLLHAGPAQARSQEPGEQPVAKGVVALAEQGTETLTMTVEATSTVVVPGQKVTYTIELGLVGGDSPLPSDLVNIITSRIHPYGMLVQATGGVTPTTARLVWADGYLRRGGPALRWTGAIAPDSSVRIRYPAEVKPCYDPELATIRNTVAARGPDGSIVTASAEIAVDCGPAADPAKVSVSFGFGPVYPAGWEADTGLGPVVGPMFPAAWERSLIARIPAHYEIELVNADTSPTVLGLFGVFPSRYTKISMPTLQRVTSLGFRVEIDGLRNDVAADTQNVLFLAPLAPGETKIVTVPIQLVEDAPPEAEL